MLETLRGYGAGLLDQAGERDRAQAALARYAVGVAEEAGAGVLTTAGELAGARWLDAEDAAIGHVLGWAVEHDLDTAVRLVSALGMWWVLRGRLAGQEPLLLELAGRAGAGSEGWCAAQFWLGWIAFEVADLPGALRRCAAAIDVIGDREPSRLLVDCLSVQSAVLSNLGRVPEAAGCSRRALGLARELGYSFGQVFALNGLVIAASYDGDLDEAVELARQPCRFRTSVARDTGHRATCWRGRWPGPGTWPPPRRPVPPRWPAPGMRAMCMPCPGCCRPWRTWTCAPAGPPTPPRTCTKRPGSSCKPVSE